MNREPEPEPESVHVHIRDSWLGPSNAVMKLDLLQISAISRDLAARRSWWVRKVRQLAWWVIERTA